MNTQEAIEKIENHLQLYKEDRDPIIELLQQGEVYKEMWAKLKEIHGDGSITTYYVDVGKGETKKELYATRLRTFMNEWEKYFPKDKVVK